MSSTIEWVSIDEAFVGLSARDQAPRAVESRRTSSRAFASARAGRRVRSWRARRRWRAWHRGSARPRGVVHVLDGYEARFLSPLKIEMLPELELPVARRLRAGGVRRLGQLARLSESQLASLTGRAGLDLVRRAAGRDTAVVRRAGLPVRPVEESPAAGTDRGSRRDRARGGRQRRASQSRACTSATCSRDRSRCACAMPTAAPNRGRRRSPSRQRCPTCCSRWPADLLDRVDRPGHLVRSVGISCSGLHRRAARACPVRALTLTVAGHEHLAFASTLAFTIGECRAKPARIPKPVKSAAATRSIMRCARRPASRRRHRAELHERLRAARRHDPVGAVHRRACQPGDPRALSPVSRRPRRLPKRPRPSSSRRFSRPASSA